MLFLTIILLGVVFFACIRAGILSKLAVKKPKFAISSFDDILNSDYLIGTMPGGSSQKFYEKAPEGTLQKRIWKEKIEPSSNSVLMDTSMGLKAVSERENYAYSIYNSIGVTSPLHPCGITGVGPIFNLKSSVFAFKKDSALTEIFNHYLMRMKESGLLDKIIGTFIVKSYSQPICDWSLENSLGLETLFGLFSEKLQKSILTPPIVFVIFGLVVSAQGLGVVSTGEGGSAKPIFRSARLTGSSPIVICRQKRSAGLLS